MALERFKDDHNRQDNTSEFKGYIAELTKPKVYKVQLEMEEYGVCYACNMMGLRHCESPEKCNNSITAKRPKLTNNKYKVLKIIK